MGVFELPMYILVFTTILHLILCYVMVIEFHMGIYGCGLATCVVFCLDFIILLLGMEFIPRMIPRESWHFFNRDSFINFKEILKYGIPSAFMTALEWIGFLFLMIFSGWIDVNSLAISTVLLNLCNNIYLIPLGISTVVNTLVGNSLGANQPRRARKYCIASLFFGICTSLTIVLLMFAFPRQTTMIYTNNDEITDGLIEFMDVIASMILVDACTGVLSGSIRA